MTVEFANLDFEGYCPAEESGLKNINIGDFIEILAIDHLYSYMGIPHEKIKKINFYELNSYSGPQVILPINFRLMADYPVWDFSKWSKQIIPVFIGVSIVSLKLKRGQTEYLKRWEPIGCRDENTYKMLLEFGIEAYLSGCVTMTMPMRKNIPEIVPRKVFFIDVPLGVEKYVPVWLEDDIEILEHEFYKDIDPQLLQMNCKNYTQQRIQKYAAEAKMIVTSRFHGAICALALGIPVIVTIENFHDKFKVLDKLVPIYDSSNFNEINWNPKNVVYEKLKNQMLHLAAMHLFYKQSCIKKETRLDVGSFIKHTKNLTCFFLHASKREVCEDSLIFSEKAIQFIEKNWKCGDSVEYALWGVSKTGLNIIDFITANYQNAKLKELYDTYKAGHIVNINGKDYEILSPVKNSLNKPYFIFVASNSASKIAEVLFEKLNKKNFFLCHLEFIKTIGRK